MRRETARFPRVLGWLEAIRRYLEFIGKSIARDSEESPGPSANSGLRLPDTLGTLIRGVGKMRIYT